MRDRALPVTIEAIAYHLPPRIEDGSVLVRDNPDWRIADIERKTGVRSRHLAAPGQTSGDLAVLAAEQLFAAGVRREDLDFLILVTQSPDYVLPTSACVLQHRLRLPQSCMAFDVNLGCSGFVYGLAQGASLIAAGMAQRGLLICSETYSKYIQKQDRTCRPLFSDGAAATILGAATTAAIGPFVLGTDGSGAEHLVVESGVLRMEGAKVFQFTMDRVPQCVTTLLERSGQRIEDIDLFVFHQASKLVLDHAMRRLGLPEEKVFVNMEHVGNTVSASIPIALKDAVAAGRLAAGDQVMLVGFGVGYSWGACLVRWGEIV